MEPNERDGLVIGSWQRWFDEEMDPYYLDVNTGETTWECPHEFHPPLKKPPWELVYTEQKEPYYHNTSTGDTCWEIPAQLQLWKEVQANVDTRPAKKRGGAQHTGTDSPHALAPAAAGVAAGVGGDAPPSTISHMVGEPGLLANDQESLMMYSPQELGFKTLLTELDIPVGATYTEISSKYASILNNHEEIRSVASHRRVQIFLEYVLERNARILRAQRRAIHYTQDEFINLLEGSHVELCTFEEAAERLQEKPRWQAIKSDMLRQYIYESWSLEKERRRWDEDDALQKQALDTMTDLVKDTIKSHEWTWEESMALFSENDNWNRLTLLQQINLHRSHMEDNLWKKFNGMEDKEKAARSQASRLARYQLFKLLNRLMREGKIHYAMSWRTFQQQMAPGDILEPFENVGYFGSAPRDLYYSFLDKNLKADYLAAVGPLAPLIKENSTSFELFEEVVRANSIACPQMFVHLYFNEYTEETRGPGRQLLIQALEGLKHEAATWSQVRSALRHDAFFQALPEEVSKQLYHEWRSSLGVEEGEVPEIAMKRAHDSTPLSPGKDKKSKKKKKKDKKK